jgi:hypothetical protein
LVIDEFARILGDAADERPLQRFLADQPTLLAPLAPPGSGFWCLDRPPLGSEFIPDFLLATRSSAGFCWTMVELEGPNERALTKSGLPARKLAEAMKQVRDWRSWLRVNIAYARNQLGLTEIDGECHACVIIGKRAALEPKHAQVYREISNDRTTVMSYDRLLEMMK